MNPHAQGIRITRRHQPAPCPLLPPEAFPDTRPDRAERAAVDRIPDHETGPNSRSVRARLASSCAGWPEPPSAQEFYAAVRAPATMSWRFAWYAARQAAAAKYNASTLSVCSSESRMVCGFSKVGGAVCVLAMRSVPLPLK